MTTGSASWLEPKERTRFNSHLGLGAIAFYPVYFERPYVGVSAYWAVRPSGAKYFIPEFERLNVGLEVSVTNVNLTSNRGFIDALLVLHKYLTPPDGAGGDAAFAGGGIGILGIRWNSENVAFRDVSFIMEMGYAYRPYGNLVVTFKMQARYLEAGPINFDGLGAIVTVGWRYD